MGLYRIPIYREKIEAIPQLMQSLGFPVVRTENQDGGILYYCHNPKRPNKNWSFCIVREKKGGLCFFTCGLSQVSKRIVSLLTQEAIFYKQNSSQDAANARVLEKLDRSSAQADRPTSSPVPTNIATA
jgi:hypothetical protein